MFRARHVPLLLVLLIAASSCGGDGGAPSITSGAATTTTTAGTTTAGTTTAGTTSTGPADPDGIANGRYLGDVRLAGEPAAVVYEVLAGIVEIDVTDDEIRATVEFTSRVSIRTAGQDPVCIATTSRRYHGRGLPANPLRLVMEPRGLEVLSLEGPQCGIVGGLFDAPAEEDLFVEFAEERPESLVGSFHDARFEGIIADVLGVTAALEP